MRTIPLNASTIAEEEIAAAMEVLRSGRFTMGAKCREFEDAFASYLGARHAVFVNSGSSANLLACFALANPSLPVAEGRRRLDAGAEVIVPAVTWSTTIWPIVQAGGVPVLVDSDPLTLQMDVEAVGAAIGPKTIGICAVHVLGNAVPMEPVCRLAAEHRLWVIEDTCEALGTRQNGRLVGTFGNLGSFSFFFSHHITTIEGGMVTTDNDELAELLRCLRAHGWTRDLRNRGAVENRYPDIDPHFMFVNTGFNVRPTEINAALGLHQLKKLDRFNCRRMEIVERWNSMFAPLIAAGRFQPIRSVEGTASAWFGYPIICADKATRDGIRAHLTRHGVETRPIVCGNMARQPAIRSVPHRVAGPLSGADIIMDRGLLWGAHPMMCDADIEYTAGVVCEFFR